MRTFLAWSADIFLTKATSKKRKKTFQITLKFENLDEIIVIGLDPL